MKIQTIKSAVIDSYGNKYIHKTTNKINKRKQIATEIVSCNNTPLYKKVTDGNTTKEFDKNLFGGWTKRK